MANREKWPQAARRSDASAHPSCLQIAASVTQRVRAFTLPNPQPGQLLDLDWRTFGHGIERLAHQIKNLGQRLDADIWHGINEAGLVMAAFLASAQFGRCPIGYLKCVKVRDDITLDP